MSNPDLRVRVGDSNLSHFLKGDGRSSGSGYGHPGRAEIK